jgi:hypothetical protein
VTGDTGSYRRLADLMIGAKIAIALRAAAEYRIADRLAGGQGQQRTSRGKQVWRRTRCAECSVVCPNMACS